MNDEILNQTNQNPTIITETGIKIPDHCRELKDISKYIKQIKKEIKTLEIENEMNIMIYSNVLKKIMNCLNYTGKLSEPILDISDQIRLDYYNQFPRTPQLAKSLWLNETQKLNKQYDLMKNRMFDLIEKLDELYIRVLKLPPPIGVFDV
jgi:hypothetical protein